MILLDHELYGNLTTIKNLLVNKQWYEAVVLFLILSELSKPADKTFQELVRMMTNHKDPKPNSIAERSKFNNRDRKPGQSIAEYIAELRRLTAHCNFGTILQDMLRDRLFCGLKKWHKQQRLLTEGGTLEVTSISHGVSD